MDTEHETKTLIKKTTLKLIESHGLNIGVNQIIKESKVTKGSFYFHFPQGKNQILEEILIWAHKIRIHEVDKYYNKKRSLGESLNLIAKSLAKIIEKNKFLASDPISRIAMDAAQGADDLYNLSQKILKIRRHFHFKKCLEYGFNQAQAKSKAQFIVCAFEGGIVLCRAHKSTKPLLRVGHELNVMFKNIFSLKE